MAGPIPKAPAATAAAASFQATGTLDLADRPALTGKGNTKVEVLPLKPEGPVGSAARGNDDTTPVGSPRRSKSQLSLLLDRDRRLSEEGSKRGQQKGKQRMSSP